MLQIQKFLAHCSFKKNKISNKFIIFNLGSGKSYSVLDVVNEVKNLVTKRLI